MSLVRRGNLSLRPSEVVVGAIHSLNRDKGSSPKDIINFISDKYELNTDNIKNHVAKALKRGVCFGVLSENNGLYRLLDSERSKCEVEKSTVLSGSYLGPSKERNINLGKTVKKPKRVKGVQKCGRGIRNMRGVKSLKKPKKTQSRKKPGQRMKAKKTKIDFNGKYNFVRFMRRSKPKNTRSKLSRRPYQRRK